MYILNPGRWTDRLEWLRTVERPYVAAMVAAEDTATLPAVRPTFLHRPHPVARLRRMQARAEG